MTFPQAVKVAFPHREHSSLRARILELAKDGGKIGSIGQEFNLTTKEWITFRTLQYWLARGRGEDDGTN